MCAYPTSLHLPHNCLHSLLCLMSSRGCVTRKANKDAHPGKIVAPRARKSNKDAQTERDATAAAKATISVTQKGQVKAVAALEDAMTIDDENEAAHAARPMVTRGLSKATRVTNRDVDVIMSGHYYIPSSSWSFTNRNMILSSLPR